MWPFLWDRHAEIGSFIVLNIVRHIQTLRFTLFRISHLIKIKIHKLFFKIVPSACTIPLAQVHSVPFVVAYTSTLGASTHGVLGFDLTPKKLKILIFVVFVDILQFSWGFQKDFHQNLQKQKKDKTYMCHTFLVISMVFWGGGVPNPEKRCLRVSRRKMLMSKTTVNPY